MDYGTLTLFDQTVAGTTVQDFGESRAYDVLSRDLAAYNASIAETLTELSDPTDQTQAPYGDIGNGEMVEVDEMGTADAQRGGQTSTVGFPLRLYTFTLQWTRLWMLQNTIRRLEVDYKNARKADYLNLQKQLKRAIFTPTNNLTYVDVLATRTTYALRALVNADSQPIPSGPNGEVFDGATHTHYLANATLTNAALLNLVNTVIEHGHGGDVRIYVNRADETAVRGLADFKAYMDARIIPANTSDVARGALDITRLDNRAIGLFNGAEVWIKPWVPANYAFAFDRNGPKPLGFRTRSGNGQLGNLQIAAEHESHPLRAQFMEREFGFGAWNRTNGAVLYFAGGAYVAP